MCYVKCLVCVGGKIDKIMGCSCTYEIGKGVCYECEKKGWKIELLKNGTHNLSWKGGYVDENIVNIG